MVDVTGPLFDSYVMVDWSARSKPAIGKDSIWIASGHRDQGDLLPISAANPATRHIAAAQLRAELTAAVRDGRRVLVGCDFSYGYPRGFAGRLGLGASRWGAVWRHLSEAIDDDEGNANNRFEVAADLNRRCAVAGGPFWGHDGKDYGQHLSRYGTDWTTCELPRLRLTEAAMGPQTVQESWKLFGAGSVGSQALLGIPRVSRLRWDKELAAHSVVWPFETGFSSERLLAGGPLIVHVEIWPGLLGDLDVRGRVPDQAQVEEMVRRLADVDDRGRLRQWFEPPASLSADDLTSCVAEEGWIFGTGLGPLIDDGTELTTGPDGGMSDHSTRREPSAIKRREGVPSQRGYNTNLASEFYVLSMLYRLGLDANLTLGNKKSVDITVAYGPGRAATVDVKAVAGKMDWLMGTPSELPKPNHFIVLVSYEGKFADPSHPPRCWVVPYNEILPLIQTASGKGRMRYLPRKLVTGTLADFESAWFRLSSL